MSWLEIGCPYCPSVLTVPQAAAGRTVLCPECGKSYVVPDPQRAVVSRAAASAAPPPPLPSEAAPAAKAVSSAVAVAAAPPPRADRYDAMQPELSVDGPLPELEILAPPPARHGALPPTTLPNRPATEKAAEPDTQTLQAVPPPARRQPIAAADDDGLTDEVKQRFERERRRARANLIVFGVGILVMTIFAFVVIRIARR